jgi:hypothetical protein
VEEMPDEAIEGILQGKCLMPPQADGWDDISSGGQSLDDMEILDSGDE